PKLLSMVDSIELNYPPALNKKLYTLEDIWSTYRMWNTIEIINNENESVRLTRTHYEEHSYFIPWDISLNGYTVTTTNMAIPQFIQEVYPTFITGGNRVAALHSLVKALYQMKK
ncbi:MAG: hypothetical protein J7578_25530, partial [Chitinophagaceae bacterium]|nr:hypothetical protein [Chitinophagaceae bacterium]